MKIKNALALVLTLGSLALACAAPADEPTDLPSASLDDGASDTTRPTMVAFEMDDNACGQSCSVTCRGGSCSASAPKGGTDVCCFCQNGEPRCQ